MWLLRGKTAFWSGMQFSPTGVIHLKISMGNLLYVVAVVLVIVWLIGFVGFAAGGIIHVLLVIAVVAVLLNIISGSRKNI